MYKFFWRTCILKIAGSHSAAYSRLYLSLHFFRASVCESRTNIATIQLSRWSRSLNLGLSLSLFEVFCLQNTLSSGLRSCGLWRCVTGWLLSDISGYFVFKRGNFRISVLEGKILCLEKSGQNTYCRIATSKKNEDVNCTAAGMSWGDLYLYS